MLLNKSFWKIWLDNVWVTFQICVVVFVGLTTLFGPVIITKVYQLAEWTVFPFYGIALILGGSFIIAVIDYHSRKNGM